MIVRITWKRLALAVAIMGVAAMLFAWSGAMQVSASSGHWRITDWFLHWVMRNSVRSYSALQTPKKVRSDEGLISAAGHFRQACQVCHGAPGVRPSPVMQAATPPAPDLSVTAKEWTDRELFWIIRHGVKFTAMPAWPAGERDDEIRHMVAFVRHLPDMTPQQYRALSEQTDNTALPGVKPGVLASCTACHGTDGLGRGQGDIPILGGQNPAYLLGALRSYASGARKSAVMQAAAASLAPAEMERLAGHFAAMPGLSAEAHTENRLITDGDRNRQLPACQSCHGRGKEAPILSRQKQAYLRARLLQWQGEQTIVDSRKPADTMAVVARRISPDDIGAVATAFAQSGPRE